VSDVPAFWWNGNELDRDRWGIIVEPALDLLLRARDRHRLPHALLMVGPAGLGRELAAVEAAALLVCPGVDVLWSDDPCAERVRNGVHPDVVAVQPVGVKGVIKIEQVREVVQTARSRPYEGERRVWIFDGVGTGTFGAEAANAFLKTLEEPPPHAMFVLMTDNESAVLPTIRSRCQKLSLPGAVAVARQLGSELPVPELAGFSMMSDDADESFAGIRAALQSGKTGDMRGLLRLPYALPNDVSPFASVAAVALEMAGEVEEDPHGEELALLATDLLEVERRSRALNLNPRTQMVSSLLRWYRGL
jgi:hypothetical protein